MKLLYIANIRLPTERAHGVQIVQNCEAFAAAGAEVTLWIARRFQTAELRDVQDVWAHYGVARRFGIRRLPCLDLLPLVPERSDGLAKAVFGLQLLTFTLSAFLGALFSRADIFYSRDPLILLCLSLIKPRGRLAYEAHLLAQGRVGRWVERQVLRRVNTVFTTTRHLADTLIERGAQPDRTHPAHDGIRAERFAGPLTVAAARAKIGLTTPGFVVGYVGRFQTMALDKGVGLLVEAAARVEGLTVMLVGGPAEIAEGFQAEWTARGCVPERFFAPGQVTPEAVPQYLYACDVLAIPSPPGEWFAYHSSPMKLFEYMAAKRSLLASDLPALREVVDERSAVLLPPQDVAAWADALQRLRDDPALRESLAETAHALVMREYTWESRTRMILSALGGADAGGGRP
ncbi:MAG: glycosyltransferase [Chloroflexi bacterium]|nr:glycosyltransferase [Chloroflexota bacterium]